MELHAWADGTMSALSIYTSITALVGENWQEWGMFFFNCPQLGILDPPNPYDYGDDWVAWGQRLADGINNAGAGVNGGPPPFPPLLNGRFLITQSNNFITAQSGAFLITQR